jgi:GDP-mannose 6-dehydrogenase
MNISIFGLGYVGAVSAACLAKNGHNILGVDVEPTKVELINNGKTPIIEKDIADLIEKAVQAGQLRATTNTSEAIINSELSFICVGTPSQLNGDLDLKYIRRVCKQIGKALKSKSERHIVVIRSTILPGTMRKVIIPLLEQYSGKIAGEDLGICNNPEFMREGNAVHDFYHPPKTVIGETDKQSGDILASIYKSMNAPLIRIDLETAEMVKYVDNIWHALKIGFANEIGNVCKVLGIDGQRIMDIFCQDIKLNISSSYLKPGFAFGGSCLPKDLRAFTYKARGLDLDLPILNSILPSNILQIERGLRMIMEKGNKKVGVLGFGFKAGTDDLRESPMVEVIERLLGKGYEICIYDRYVKLASLVGANRDYILNRISHISSLMVDSIEEVLSRADTLVIGNSDEEFSGIMGRIKDGQVVVDLVRITENKPDKEMYDGICW